MSIPRRLARLAPRGDLPGSPSGPAQQAWQCPMCCRCAGDVLAGQGRARRQPATTRVLSQVRTAGVRTACGPGTSHHWPASPPASSVLTLHFRPVACARYRPRIAPEPS